jgi:hypothetical protein
VRRYSWCMPRREDDDALRASPFSGTRVLPIAAGFLLAAGATLAVFLTDNPQLLRIAVVAVAWAFVLATFAAGRRSGDRAAAAAREAQLRRVYEHELDLEVAARREYELELENELRRETEDAMRDELDALRGELAALADLRDQVAGVAALRDDVVALSALREDVARVAALREDIAALGALRQELGQLHGLRDDMGRLRAELTEQLSSEMLVERIVMRTQGSRLPADASRLEAPGRTVEGAVWGDELPRELTGGWPAVRLDDAREVHTTGSWTPPAPATSVFVGPQPARLCPPPASGSGSTPPPPADPPPPPTTTSFPLSPPAVEEPAPSPLDWLASRSLVDIPPPPPSQLPPVPPSASRPGPRPSPHPSPRRRRSDEAEPPPVPGALAPTTEHPRVAPEARPAAPAPATSPGIDRPVADILAKNGGTPPSGGRRRRRYREDGDPDDVLARVLGR